MERDYCSNSETQEMLKNKSEHERSTSAPDILTRLSFGYRSRIRKQIYDFKESI